MMTTKLSLVFLLSLSSLIFQETVALYKINRALMYTALAAATSGVGYVVYNELQKTPTEIIPDICTDDFSADGACEIIRRKINCEYYREVIKESQETLNNNKAIKEFYTGNLAPIGYIRYLLGFDERLKESNARAIREIHFFTTLLGQNYCTDSEE